MNRNQVNFINFSVFKPCFTLIKGEIDINIAIIEYFVPIFINRKKVFSKSSYSYLYLLILIVFQPTKYFYQTISNGTMAIVHRNNLGVFVGIDSKISIDGKPSPEVECKIGIKNNVVFLCTGNCSAEPFYNSFTIARSIIDSTISIKDITDKFSNSIIQLTTKLDSARLTDPVRFDHAVSDSTLFNLIIIKKENESILIAILRFNIIYLSNGHIAIGQKSHIGANTPAKTDFFGHISTIQEIYRKTGANPISQAKTPIDIGICIINLIRSQCKATPDYVGEPIYILWFSPTNGIRWLNNHPPCNCK
jgi:hypothetical protein